MYEYIGCFRFREQVCSDILGNGWKRKWKLQLGVKCPAILPPIMENRTEKKPESFETGLVTGACRD